MTRVPAKEQKESDDRTHGMRKWPLNFDLWTLHHTGPVIVLHAPALALELHHQTACKDDQINHHCWGDCPCTTRLTAAILAGDDSFFSFLFDTTYSYIHISHTYTSVIHTHQPYIHISHTYTSVIHIWLLVAQRWRRKIYMRVTVLGGDRTCSVSSNIPHSKRQFFLICQNGYHHQNGYKGEVKEIWGKHPTPTFLLFSMKVHNCLSG